MALKDVWKDKTNDVDDVLAENINIIAESVIECESDIQETIAAVNAFPEPVGKKITEDLGGVVVYRGEIFNDYEHNLARGDYSHAEGINTKAFDNGAHSEGMETEASGIGSHTEGIGTKSSRAAQHVQGMYNEEDADGKYAHIVGGGDGDASRINIHTLDWNGAGWFASEIKIGGAGQNDPNAQIVATKTDINEIVAEMSSVLDELHAYAQALISGGAK